MGGGIRQPAACLEAPSVRLCSPICLPTVRLSTNVFLTPLARRKKQKQDGMRKSVRLILRGAGRVLRRQVFLPLPPGLEKKTHTPGKREERGEEGKKTPRNNLLGSNQSLCKLVECHFASRMHSATVSFPLLGKSTVATYKGHAIKSGLVWFPTPTPDGKGPKVRSRFDCCAVPPTAASGTANQDSRVAVRRLHLWLFRVYGGHDEPKRPHLQIDQLTCVHSLSSLLCDSPQSLSPPGSAMARRTRARGRKRLVCPASPAVHKANARSPRECARFRRDRRADTPGSRCLSRAEVAVHIAPRHCRRRCCRCCSPHTAKSSASSNYVASRGGAMPSILTFGPAIKQPPHGRAGRASGRANGRASGRASAAPPAMPGGGGGGGGCDSIPFTRKRRASATTPRRAPPRAPSSQTSSPESAAAAAARCCCCWAGQ